jgi:hypothetical protein
VKTKEEAAIRISPCSLVHCCWPDLSLRHRRS